VSDVLAQRTNRILVVRLGAIGDALRVLPAVRRLRMARPDVTIGWAVEEWVYPVLAENPNIDRFHVLDRRTVRAGPLSALTEMRRFLREVRSSRYDTVLDFHGRLKSGVVSALSGAAVRIGYARDDCTEGNHLFNNIHVRLADGSENRVLRFLHLLTPLGIEAVFDPVESGLHVAETARRHARDWYARNGSPALAVFPGTSHFQAGYHRWLAEKWVGLLRRLGREHIAAVIFWGPDDAHYARSIAAEVPGTCALAPATTLPEMMAMLACFKAFIGTNTAAMHMAWLQGVPTAVFTGPASPRTDAPLPPVPSRVLRANEHWRAGVSKRHLPAVVSAVTVEEALEAVKSLLDRGSTEAGNCA
jgi:ADP-heptose:LPS heptosyltransferase